MARVEVYYYEKLIKKYNDPTPESIDGIVDFVMNSLQTLAGPFGGIVIKNKVIEDSGKLKEEIKKAINKKENIKIEIRSILLDNDVVVQAKNTPRQIETMRLLVM